MRWERFTDEKGYEFVRKVIEPADRLSWAGVPDRHCAAVLSPPAELVATPALELAKSLVAGRGKLLVLSSSPGLGKSVAAAYAVAYLPARPGALWVDAPALARVQQRREEGDETIRLQTLDERMASAGLLVLDDVGLEHSPSGYAAARITEALTSREASALPTVVTTNLSAAQFSQRYGPRIVSRLGGDGLGFHTLVGPDLRRAA